MLNVSHKQLLYVAPHNRPHLLQLVKIKVNNEEELISDVQSRINYGDDINQIDNNGKTALHWAVIRGYKNIVHLLITNGADVSIINTVNDSTPFNHAVYYGQLEILQMLILANREIFNLEMTRVDKFGYTPIHRALERGKLHIVEELIKQYPDALAIKNGKGIAAKDFKGSERAQCEQYPDEIETAIVDDPVSNDMSSHNRRSPSPGSP